MNAADANLPRSPVPSSIAKEISWTRPQIVSTAWKSKFVAWGSWLFRQQMTLRPTKPRCKSYSSWPGALSRPACTFWRTTMLRKKPSAQVSKKRVPHLRSSCILYTQILHLVAEQSKPPRPPLPLYKSYVRLKLATPCRFCQTPPVHLKVIPHGLWLLNLPPQSPDDNSAPHGLTPICLALSPKMQMENGLRWDANWDNPRQSPAKNLASNPKERAKADGYPQKNAGTVQEGKGTAVATGPESLKVWTVDT